MGMYSVFFQSRDNEFTWQPLYIKDGKFCVETSKEGAYIYFENLDEFLRYLFKREFYQGKAFRADNFIMRTKDGSEIQYQNPFKGA